MTADVSDVVRALRARIAAVTADPAAAGGVVAPDAAPSAGAAAPGGPTAPTEGAPATPSGTGTHTVAGAGVGIDHGADTDTEGLTEEERAEEVQARNICLRLLADSARPRAGLADKLARRGISAATIERVLDRFTEVGLIDDQAYAEAYVRSKHQERSLSRRALTAELRRKGLDDAVVSTAAEAVDPEAEEAAALRLITKRAPAALAAAGPDGARRRLLALLDRRGYPAELSIRVVEGVLARRGE